MTDQIKTNYLDKVYNVSAFARTVKSTISLANQVWKQWHFDAIAFTGTSGAAMAYILSAELGIPLVCIRKDNDDGHFAQFDGLMEGFMASKRYIIVDDRIVNGATINRIASQMRVGQPNAKCVGIILYHSTRSTSEWNQQVAITASTGKLIEAIEIPVLTTSVSAQRSFDFMEFY